MNSLWKACFVGVAAGAVAGFVCGIVGARIENYYTMSGPSFPGLTLGGLRVLGYPGFVFAGRTGPHGYNEFANSYNVGTVALWNSLAWAIVLPMFLCVVIQLVRLLRGRSAS